MHQRQLRSIRLPNASKKINSCLPGTKNKTLDHCLDLGDEDYDARADWCAGFSDRRARAECYRHCNDNKNEWNNYCRYIYVD